MKRIRRVLHPTDFSGASRAAFATALTMSKSLNATLTIVYVIASFPPMAPEQYIDMGTLDRLEEQTRVWATRRLKALADRARKQGTRATTVLREGDVADEIVRIAKASRADLIVVGTHGRRGIPRFFLGSVAERVVRMAPCAVMSVRGR
jgi:nucleotide-binding universal stress UspA family protein